MEKSSEPMMAANLVQQKAQQAEKNLEAMMASLTGASLATEKV